MKHSAFRRLFALKIKRVSASSPRGHSAAALLGCIIVAVGFG
jgi:hypothetical protein